MRRPVRAGGRGAGLRFACLGSSGAVPTADRDTTALLNVGYREHARLGARVAEARAAFGGPVIMAKELHWHRA